MQILLWATTAETALQIEKTATKLFPETKVTRVPDCQHLISIINRFGTRHFSTVVVEIPPLNETGQSRLELAVTLRSEHGFKIIAVASHDTEQTRTHALVHDADAFVPMPINENRFAQLLSKEKLYWEMKELPSSLAHYWEQRACKNRSVA